MAAGAGDLALSFQHADPVAPGALPAPSSTWLKHLAQALEEAGRPHLADNLRTALEQFAVR